MHSSRKKHSADCARQCFGSGLNPDSNGSVGIRIRNQEHKNVRQKTPCFEQLDVVFEELEASPRASKSLMEA